MHHPLMLVSKGKFTIIAVLVTALLASAIGLIVFIHTGEEKNIETEKVRDQIPTELERWRASLPYYDEALTANKLFERVDNLADSSFLAVEGLAGNQVYSFRGVEFVRSLGAGGFSGEVDLLKKDGKEYVVKKMLINDGYFTNGAKMEVETLGALLGSRFVPRLYRALKVESYYYIFMEHIEGKKLNEYMAKPLSENMARFITAEVLLALNDIHKKGYIYRGIDPENIVMTTEKHVRLINLNYAIKKDSKEGKMCGRSDYMAPEVRSGPTYSESTDYHALGCLTYHMVTGGSPFTVDPKGKMSKRHKIRPEWSKDLKDFVERLLPESGVIRLGSGGVEYLMEHAFFKGKIDFSRLENGEGSCPK